MLAASGIPELTPQQVNKSIGCNGADLLLDVRSQQEWGSGHHPGATHAESLAERGLIFFPELLNCVNCRIIVVSFLGERATRAANMLVAAGFRDVFIGGGTFHWIMDGFSLVEGDSMPAMCSNNGCQARTTTALCNESLNELENIVRATGVNSLIAALPNESLESEVYCLALVNLRIAARLAKNNGELDDKTTRRVRRKANQLMRSKGCRSR